VGIDYALFIINALPAGARARLDAARSHDPAMATAGRAVLFAGGTVVISLLAP